MRTTLAMLCVLGAALAGFTQDKNFDLSKYKFPDYKRYELELNFNSFGGIRKYFIETPETNNSVALDQSNSSFKSNFNLGYNYENFTRKRMDFIQSTFMGQYDYSKNNQQEERTKQSDRQTRFDFLGYSRYYLTRDKLFMEGITDLSINYSGSKYTYDYDIPSASSNSRRNDLDLSAGMAIGIGRIEKVNDLWQAYYILEKLNEQKSINRELQENDIFEFAYLASKLKNKRFFDARLRKIGELQTLDSLMHSQGLVSNGDIAYFTTLNDYWSYGNFPERKSGKELKLQVMPQLVRNYSKYGNDPSVAPTQTNLVSTLQFDWSKQINLMWERNLHISLANTTLLAKNDDVEVNYPDNLKSTNASIGFGFFPNSRTSFSVSGNYSGNDNVYFQGDNASINWFNNLYLNFAANYYLSPQLQITANLLGNYTFSKFRSIDREYTTYNLGLRYAIF